MSPPTLPSMPSPTAEKTHVLDDEKVSGEFAI